MERALSPLSFSVVNEPRNWRMRQLRQTLTESKSRQKEKIMEKRANFLPKSHRAHISSSSRVTDLCQLRERNKDCLSSCGRHQQNCRYRDQGKTNKELFKIKSLTDFRALVKRWVDFLLLFFRAKFLSQRRNYYLA